MSQCGLIDIEASHPQIPTQVDADSGSAVPVANVIEFFGDTVANATNAKPLFSTASGNTVTYEMQVGAAVTGAPADSNDAGLVSFDDTMFTVDANGYVQLIGGGTAIDTITGDDGSAVSPDGAGNFNVVGTVVANATNAKPLYFDGTAAANTQTLELQVATGIAAAPADSNDAGIASFSTSHFTVDANGFVELAGGGVAIDSNTGDDSVAVSADAAGNFNWLGQTVANATHAKPVYFKDSATANALDLDVQVGAAVTGAPGDKNDAGLVSLDDTIFTCDADGYVSLATTGVATTITGDSGGALSPVANNWNILGLSGSKTSGSGATLTVKSPPYADSTAATLTINSGTFATAAGAYTLPAAPADGDLVEIVCITTGIVVTANTSQEIQIAGDVTSTAGTATNSAKGDALVLRYRSTDTAWYATSSMGVWVLA